MLLDRLAVIDPVASATLTVGLRRKDYDPPGKPQILWVSADARGELINNLFADATTIIDACAGIDNEVPVAHVELLRTLLAKMSRTTTQAGCGFVKAWPRIARSQRSIVMLVTVIGPARIATTATSCMSPRTPSPI